MLGGSRSGEYASLGDIIVVSVKEAIPNAKVKKGDVMKAVIVRTAKEVGRADGSYIRFDTNSAVLIDNAARADRNPHLRPGRARAAREAVHEDHLARAGGAVSRMARRARSIRKNDTVMVIAGRERGKTGKVLRVLREKQPRHHRAPEHGEAPPKPRGAQSPGGIVEKEASIHLSNVHAHLRALQRAGAHRRNAGSRTAAPCASAAAAASSWIDR